jgi:hypothetical protein
MTDLATWQAANDRYLADELRALRRALIQLANRSAPPPSEAPQVRFRFWRRWLDMLFAQGVRKARGTLTADSVEPLPGGDLPPPLAEGEPVPALKILAERLGLNELERRTLLLCAAMEYDTSIGQLCARALRDPAQPYPSFAVALAAFEDASWDLLSPERPLRRWRLIDIAQPGAQPLITSRIKADERIVSYIKGLNYLDDRLTTMVSPLAAEPGDLPPSQAAVAKSMLAEIDLARASGALPILQLLGPDAVSKRAVAAEVAAALGVAAYRLSADALPQNVGDSETFTLLWQRESALLPLALYVDAGELDRSDAAKAAPLLRLLRGTTGIIFLDTRDTWTGTGRAGGSFEVARPSPEEQLDAWRTTLGDDGPIAARLAGQFSLDLPAIRRIASEAIAVAGNDSEARDERLWRACQASVRPALDQLAQPIVPKAGWDDLELPPAESRQLRQITAQVRNRTAVYDEMGFRKKLNRGFGISVLFAGESGTGKTMAAEVIAAELDLLLYRIDLSGVVDKYIGETEKNLRRLFDAADRGGAILFFDEADALFGKRSEVKDSRDRYANIEINYLLQRMESYCGLAILTTNMKSWIDRAFLRRLRFIVNFPFPGAAERLAIWRKALPSEVRLAADVDFDRLARFNLTGGSIHNIALAASFAAADGPGEVGMAMLLDAARAEYRKLGNPINEGDFQWLTSVGGAG